MRTRRLGLQTCILYLLLNIANAIQSSDPANFTVTIIGPYIVRLGWGNGETSCQGSGSIFYDWNITATVDLGLTWLTMNCTNVVQTAGLYQTTCQVPAVPIVQFRIQQVCADGSKSSKGVRLAESLFVNFLPYTNAAAPTLVTSLAPIDAVAAQNMLYLRWQPGIISCDQAYSSFSEWAIYQSLDEGRTWTPSQCGDLRNRNITIAVCSNLSMGTHYLFKVAELCADFSRSSAASLWSQGLWTFPTPTELPQLTNVTKSDTSDNDFKVLLGIMIGSSVGCFFLAVVCWKVGLLIGWDEVTVEQERLKHEMAEEFPIQAIVQRSASYGSTLSLSTHSLNRIASRSRISLNG
eukprot:Colp12_sorted_trinity150504_noHs@5026